MQAAVAKRKATLAAKKLAAQQAILAPAPELTPAFGGSTEATHVPPPPSRRPQ